MKGREGYDPSLVGIGTSPTIIFFSVRPGKKHNIVLTAVLLIWLFQPNGGWDRCWVAMPSREEWRSRNDILSHDYDSDLRVLEYR